MLDNLFKYVFLAVFLFFGSNILVSAQTVSDDDRLQWWGDIGGFYNQQHKETLALVHKALEKYPPTLDEPLERKMAMLMLDGVLHEDSAAFRPSVQAFLTQRTQKVVDELQNVPLHEGAKVWKLYNDIFIVKTPRATIAFDLVAGNAEYVAGFEVAPALMQKLIGACNVLFISHEHGDHADINVAQEFISQGKVVVAPPIVWKGLPIYKEITHLKRKAHKQQKLRIKGGEEVLRVINYPGHQGADIENNVVVVTTPEGIGMMHTGDQSGPVAEWEWIDTISKHVKVDLLLPNCWTPDPCRMIKGVAPQVVISGHENEMGHSVDHRESNWLSYKRFKNSSKPFLLMTWGESYHYHPQKQ